LLRAGPDLCVLATSREALGVPGEVVFYVPSLSLPEASEPLASEQAKQFEGLRLFQERGAACLKGFQITDDNALTIAQICRRLDGIPLAIELAAARVRMLSVEQIAAYLDDCFHLLTGGSRTVLPRHQTLRAAIDWGYNLLSSSECSLLRRLSIFVGGLTLEAAEEVCQGNGLAQAEILDLLSGLASKSMVTVELASGGARRYKLLETIRQYGEEKLRQADEEGWCRQQHLAFFLHFAEIGDQKLHGPESLEWLRRIEADYGNLRAALEWCFGAGQAGEAGVRLANALVEFWNKGSYYYEWLTWLEKAMDQTCSMVGTPIRAKTINVYGTFTITMLGKWEEGRPLLEESLETWRKLGASYRNDLADTLTWLGNHLYDHEQPQTARDYLQEAVDIYRETGDWWGLGWTMNIFSGITYEDGYPEKAYAMAEEGVVAFQKSGDRYGIAMSTFLLGSYQYRLGDTQKAIQYIEEAQIVFREFGNKVFACQAFLILGEIARGSNDYEKAEAYYRESLSMRQEIGAGPSWLISSNLNLGYTVLYRGDFLQAASYFMQALKNSRGAEERANRKRSIIDCLAGFAAVAAARGKVETAARLYGTAEAQYQGLLTEGKTLDSLIDPVDRREFERYQAICRDRLGEAAFEAAWAEGRGLTLEQALAEALAIS